MLFIMKKKTFEKMAKKILPEKDYYIIDGENVGSLVSTSKGKTISDQFSRCYSDANFTPPKKLVKALLSDVDDEYDPDDVDEYINEYFKSKKMRSSMFKAVKCIFAAADNRKNPLPEINIFLVLPNKVYKAMAEIFATQFKHMIPDVKFVYLDKDIKKNKKLVTKSLSDDDLEAIVDRLKKIEKKINKKSKDKKNDKSDKKDKKKKKKSKNKADRERDIYDIDRYIKDI